MLGSGTWERWAREAVHREKDCEKHCVIEKSAAYAQKCIFQVPSDENLLRNGLLHANRVAPCNVMACQEGLGPSLPDLRTPDENTQVGQRAPGLAAAAPLPRPLHHAACTTPPCRPEARPSCSPHRAVEAPHLSTPQHACLLGATLGRKPCLVTWLMISAHAEPHPCSYSLFVHHAPLLSQLRA